VMVGLDVTMKVKVRREEVRMLERSGDPLNTALAKLIDRWLGVINQVCEDADGAADPLTGVGSGYWSGMRGCLRAASFFVFVRSFPASSEHGKL
jgi:hypothetical protein